MLNCALNRHVETFLWRMGEDNEYNHKEEREKYFDYKKKFIDVLPKDLEREIIRRWAAQEIDYHSENRNRKIEGYSLSADQKNFDFEENAI